MTWNRREFLVGSGALALAAGLGSRAKALSKRDEESGVFYDSIVVGGGVAGLSSALTLGRALRKVLVFSGGVPRNAPADHSHNFFTRDGESPAELLRIGREQLKPYSTVTLREQLVEEAEQIDGGFLLRAEGGEEWKTRTLVLALGVKDDISVIPGLAEQWGKSVFNCPFCHGWEHRGQDWVVVLNGAPMIAMAHLCGHWAEKLAVCTVGDFRLSKTEIEHLESFGAKVRNSPLVSFRSEGSSLRGVELADGTCLPAAAVLHRPATTIGSSIAKQLGCEMEGGFLTVSPFQQTSIAGVFAAGDITGGPFGVAKSSAQGLTAGAAVAHALLEA